MNFVAKRIAPHLRKPGDGFWGLFTKKYLIDANRPLAEATFKALNVKAGENVLELGFGYGPAIRYALNNGSRDWSGTFFAVDYSPTACNSVTKEFAEDVKCGKLVVLNEDVANMSLENSSIDKVFHTNCFYFWPDMNSVAREIARVMKPGGLIVAGLNITRLKIAASRGLLEEWQFQPERYNDALSDAGFTDIRTETSVLQRTNATIKFIYAKSPPRL